MDLFRRCMEPVEKVLRVSLLHLMFQVGSIACCTEDPMQSQCRSCCSKHSSLPGTQNPQSGSLHAGHALALRCDKAWMRQDNDMIWLSL